MLEVIPIQDVRGNQIIQPFPSALIFWASWCKPCELELARINRMVENSSLDGNKIIAISVDENLEDVISAIQKKGYKFRVAWDKDTSLRRKFNIMGTPSILLFGKEKSIIWATSGISPLLEFRLREL